MRKLYILLFIALAISQHLALQPRSYSQISAKSPYIDIDDRRDHLKLEEDQFDINPVHFFSSVFYSVHGTMVFWGPASILELKLNELQRDYKQSIQNKLILMMLGDESYYFQLATEFMQLASLNMYKMLQICSKEDCNYIRELQTYFYPNHFIEYEEYWNDFVKHDEEAPGNYWVETAAGPYWDADAYFSDQEQDWANFQEEFNQNLFAAMSSTLISACINIYGMKTMQDVQDLQVGQDDDGNLVFTEYALDQILTFLYDYGLFLGAPNPTEVLMSYDDKLAFFFGYMFAGIFENCNEEWFNTYSSENAEAVEKFNEAYKNYKVAKSNLYYYDLWTVFDENADTTGYGLLNFTQLLTETFDKQILILELADTTSTEELVLADVALEHDDNYILLKAMNYIRNQESISDQVSTFLNLFNPTDMNFTELEKKNEEYESQANNTYPLYTFESLFKQEGLEQTWEIKAFQSQYMSLFQNLTGDDADLQTFVIQIFKLFSLIDQEMNHYLQGVCGYPESYKEQNNLYTTNVDEYYQCKLQYEEVVKLKGLRIAGSQIMYLLEDVDLLAYILKETNSHFNCTSKYLQKLSEINIYEDYSDAFYNIVNGASCLLYIGEKYRSQMKESDLFTKESDLGKSYQRYYELSDFEFQDEHLSKNGKYQLQNSIIFAMAYEQEQGQKIVSRGRSQLESTLHQSFKEVDQLENNLHQLFMSKTCDAREYIVSTEEMHQTMAGLFESFTKHDHLDSLRKCISSNLFSPVLNELLNAEYKAENFGETVELLEKIIPFVLNVDYLLQNCKTKVQEVNNQERQFDEDILIFHEFVDTQYHLHSNEITLIGQLIAEYNSNGVQRSLQNLLMIQESEIKDYYELGFELGNFLTQALGTKDQMDTMSDWLSEEQTKIIQEQTATLQDDLYPLSTAPFRVPSFSTGTFTEPIGYTIGDTIGKVLSKIYKNIKKASGSSSYEEFLASIKYNENSIQVGSTQFTIKQAENEALELLTTQEELSDDLISGQANGLENQLNVEYKDYEATQELMTKLQGTEEKYDTVDFFGDVILDFPDSLEANKKIIDEKLFYMYSVMGSSVIPEIGSPKEFVRNLHCVDWC